MKVVARRDRLGARAVWFAPGSGEHSDSLAALLMRDPSARRAGLDHEGIDAAWGMASPREPGDATRSCLSAVRVVPPGGTLVHDGATLTVMEGEVHGVARDPSATATAIIEATRRALEGARRPIVALGGGIDAPLAVLAARRAGITIERAIHLAIPGTSYDESDAARETAAALGVDLHEVRITAADLAGALPRAVRLAGSPLYNLHPVSRVLLAHAACELGADALVTGDGADQACLLAAHEVADYVPIVAAITRGFDLALVSPFVDDAVVDVLAALNDPTKIVLRALAREWGLPTTITDRPKTPCWAPPMPRSAFPVAASLEPVSRALGRSLSWSADDRANVRVSSLSAFVRAFEIPTAAAALARGH